MISQNEVLAFLAPVSGLDPDKYLTLTYRFETWLEPQWAAANLCAEQSTVCWQRPGTKDDFRLAYGAKLISVKILKESKIPLYAVPLAAGKDHFYQCEARIAHPLHNFGTRLPNLLSAVAGEGVFYADGLTTTQLVDIEFPDSYARQFLGPQFGLKGLRRLLHVDDRPLFMGVVKPNLGLPPADFARLAGEAWRGGLDICKDDEMQAEVPWAPLAKRVRAITAVREEVEKDLGRKKIFVTHITDEVDQIPKNLELVVANGANAVMINPLMTGLSALRALRQKSPVPVMGHFTGEAFCGRMPFFGVKSVVWTKLMRLAGADMIGIAGFGDRMQVPESEVLENIEACLKPMGLILPALPIPGGSTTADSIPSIHKKVGHNDFAYIAGRGIFAHPEGARVGAALMTESIYGSGS